MFFPAMDSMLTITAFSSPTLTMLVGSTKSLSMRAYVFQPDILSCFGCPDNLVAEIVCRAVKSVGVERYVRASGLEITCRVYVVLRLEHLDDIRQGKPVLGQTGIIEEDIYLHVAFAVALYFRHGGDKAQVLFHHSRVLA